MFVSPTDAAANWH